MSKLLIPSCVRYDLTEEDFLKLVYRTIKETCGDINVTPHIQIDVDTNAVMVAIFEDEVSEEEAECLAKGGIRFQEWFETTQVVLHNIFGTLYASAYANQELLDDGVLNIEVYVPFSDYINNKLQVDTPKGVISATAIEEENYPCIQIRVDGEIAAITEFDSLNDSIRTCVFNHKSDEPLEIYEW